MSLALYQISNKYQQKLDVLEDYYNQDECEHNNETEQRLWNDIFSIDDALEDKAIAVASYIKNLEAELKMVTVAIKEMQERESRLKNAIEKKKKYLLEQLQAAKITEIKKSPNFVIKVKQNKKSIDDNAINIDELDDEYKRTKTEVSVDKKKLLEDLEAGVFVKGVTGKGYKQTIKLEIK